MYSEQVLESLEEGAVVTILILNNRVRSSPLFGVTLNRREEFFVHRRALAATNRDAVSSEVVGELNSGGRSSPASVIRI
jgi:hypothetical protein